MVVVLVIDGRTIESPAHGTARPQQGRADGMGRRVRMELL